MIRKISTGIIFLIMVSILLVPTKAMAHSYLVKSNPSQNEVLSETPQTISLQFSEAIQSSFHTINLVNSKGEKIKLEKTNVSKKNPSILEAQLDSDLEKSTYTVQWKVLSADGHSISGTIPFSIRTNIDNTSLMEAKSNSDTPKGDMIGLRFLLYISFALYIGVIIFHLFLYDKSLHAAHNDIYSKSSNFIWLSLIGMAISLILNLPLQTTLNADVSWTEIFTSSYLVDTIYKTTYGDIWILQIFLLIILVISTYLAIRKKFHSPIKHWIIPLLTFVGLLLTKAMSGHANSTNPKFIPVLMDLLHLSASSIWIGVLLVFVLLLPRKITNENKELYWNSINRFSLWATICISVIVVTGVYSSLLYVPTIYSLFHTLYGKLLIGKIGLFVIMLLLGAFHFVKGKKRGAIELKFSILIELVVGLFVVIMVGILTNSATALSSPGPFTQSKVMENGYEVSLQISPNIEGENSFDVTIVDEEGKKVENVEQMSLTFRHLDMTMGENTIVLKQIATGKFQTKGLYANMAGNWNVTVHVLTKSLDSFDINFRPLVGSQKN